MEGNYEPTALERAKNELRDMEEPSLDILMKNEAF
jgi:hypothetical protein